MNTEQILKQYALIKTFRRTNPAPVDTLGSSSIYKKLTGSFENKKFLLLTSLLLSAQTNDKITYVVMMKIINKKLTAFDFAELSESAISDILQGINFRKKKIKYIKNLANLAVKSKLPENIQDVLKIKGVGTKLGYMYMQTAFNQVNGISVDTHVHR